MRLGNVERNEQVFFSMDGPDGVVLQTSKAMYESYYRLLGYKQLGPAAPLFPLPQDTEVDAFTPDGVE